VCDGVGRAGRFSKFAQRVVTFSGERRGVTGRTGLGVDTVRDGIALPDNQQDRDMLARELLIRFQMSDRHPLLQLKAAYSKVCDGGQRLRKRALSVQVRLPMAFEGET